MGGDKICLLVADRRRVLDRVGALLDRDLNGRSVVSVGRHPHAERVGLVDDRPNLLAGVVPPGAPVARGEHAAARGDLDAVGARPRPGPYQLPALPKGRLRWAAASARPRARRDRNALRSCRPRHGRVLAVRSGRGWQRFVPIAIWASSPARSRKVVTPRRRARCACATPCSTCSSRVVVKGQVAKSTVPVPA